MPAQARLQGCGRRSGACPWQAGLERAAGEYSAGWVNGFRFLSTCGRHTEKPGLLYADSCLAVIPAKAGIDPFGDAGGRVASGTSGRGIQCRVGKRIPVFIDLWQAHRKTGPAVRGFLPRGHSGESRNRSLRGCRRQGRVWDERPGNPVFYNPFPCRRE